MLDGKKQMLPPGASMAGVVYYRTSPTQFSFFVGAQCCRFSSLSAKVLAVTRLVWMGFLALVIWGCTNTTVEGVWREEFPAMEEALGLPTSNSSDGRVVVHEIVLAQYGPDVAGAVWFYDQSALSNTIENPFGWPTFCRILQKGKLDESTGKLGFEFNDEQGEPVFMWLSVEEDGERLAGTVHSNEQGSGEQGNDDEVMLTRKIVFHKISGDPYADYQAGQCSGMNSIYITGQVGFELGPTPQMNPAVALVAYGVYLGQPYSVVVSSVPVSNGRFVFNLSQKPAARSLAIDTSESSFGVSTFVLFDDLNGDGVWDGGVWPGGGAGSSSGENILGIASKHALVWLTGRMGPHLSPYYQLMEGVPQGYSLVEVESGHDGLIKSVQVIPTENSVVAGEVEITEGESGPVLDFFNGGILE